LEIPPELSGVGVEGQKRARVEVVALAIVSVIIGIRIARAIVDEIQRWIVTTVTHAARHRARQPRRSPRIAAGLPGNGTV